MRPSPLATTSTRSLSPLYAMAEFDSDVPTIPDYRLSEKQFNLLQGNSGAEELKQEILAAIKEQHLAPYYKYLTTEFPKVFPLDESLLDEISAKNTEKIAALEAKIQQAESEEETDIDLVQSVTELAEYYTRIIDRANAESTYNKLLSLTQSTGLKIDAFLTLVRLDFFFNDYRNVARHLLEVKSLIEKGGDWERRNRYKTYQGIYYIATRNFEDAASLLIDSLATFTSTELCTYEQVAQFAIISGILTLERVDLKSKIVSSPEILSIHSSSKDLEPLINLTNSLYTCQYNTFFQHLLESNGQVFANSKYLKAHANYFMRELRSKAYAQLLESYKSLSLKSMAANFNVSGEFLDEDLCRFIPNNKLNCSINRVNGIIETNRPDNKNSQFHLLIKQGDGLLTKLQKYSAAVKLSGAERDIAA